MAVKRRSSMILSSTPLQQVKGERYRRNVNQLAVNKKMIHHDSMQIIKVLVTMVHLLVLVRMTVVRMSRKVLI